MCVGRIQKVNKLDYAIINKCNIDDVKCDNCIFKGSELRDLNYCFCYNWQHYELLNGWCWHFTISKQGGITNG